MVLKNTTKRKHVHNRGALTLGLLFWNLSVFSIISVSVGIGEHTNQARIHIKNSGVVSLW